MRSDLASSCLMAWLCLAAAPAEAQSSPGIAAEPAPKPPSQADGAPSGSPPLPAAPDEPLPKRPVVATSCQFKAGTPAAFGLLIGDSKVRLLDLAYKRCALEVADDGSTSVKVDIQITLNLKADVSHCNSFRLAFLFDGSVDDDRLKWPGVRKLIDALEVDNLDGDKQDIGLFSLHQESSDKPLLLGDVLFQANDKPSYSDIYWGTASILQEVRTGRLASAIRDNTPIFGAPGDKPDLEVKLNLEAYAPRGWCIFADPNGKQIRSMLSVGP